jgi:hypothetical protein
MEKQMKTQVSRARFLFTKLAMSCVLFLNAVPVIHAQTPASPPEAEIKFVGVVEEKFVFEIVYPNERLNVFSVEIKDQQGYQFYFNKLKQKGYKQQFAIDKFELANGSLTFTLTAQGNVQKQVFDINASSRTIEEVSVVKL